MTDRQTDRQSRFQNSQFFFSKSVRIINAQDQGHDTIVFKKEMAGLNQSAKCKFCKVETESTSHLLSGCNKLISEQLYTQRHNKVCGVIHRHMSRNFNIPVPQNSWKHEPKSIIENKDIILTYDLMIPSSMNTENKAL